VEAEREAHMPDRDPEAARGAAAFLFSAQRESSVVVGRVQCKR